MHSLINYKVPLLALVLLASTACGSLLRLAPEPTAATAGDSNTTGDANQTAPLDPNALKCTTGTITGAKLSNCVCSDENNEVCPIYAANPNTPTAPWTCTSLAVSGGFFYSCQCDTEQNPGACSDFYNPANPSATAKTTPSQTTCQTTATNFGYQTNCTCTDGETAPCDFYQGNSYTTATAPYVEVCGSTLHATSTTTVCTCNQRLQPTGATCPATFVPSAATVADLMY